MKSHFEKLNFLVHFANKGKSLDRNLKEDDSVKARKAAQSAFKSGHVHG